MKQIKTVFTPKIEAFERDLEKLINTGYSIIHINSAEGSGGIRPYHFFAVLEKEL
jgi:hypothetical protein